jgi:hypothetical protein
MKSSLFLGGLLLLIVGCSTAAPLRYRDDLVTVTDKNTVHYLNIESSTSDEILTLWGREYHHVRGANPCYLRLPGRPEILFVTGRTWDNGQAMVHLANTETHRVAEFPAYDSNIGRNIGPETAKQGERVSKIEGNSLIIVSHDSQGYYVYLIDLARPAFIEEDENIRNAQGDPVHTVWDQGKAPRLIP